MIYKYFNNIKTFYLFLFLTVIFTTHKIQAQCLGEDITVTICDKELDTNLQAYNLFALLDGSTPTGGTWTSDNRLNLNALDANTGIVNLWEITRSGTHSFTYTLDSCTNTSIVTIELGPYAGEDNIDRSANACADNLEGNDNNGDETNLFNFLNNDVANLKVDTNGTWEGDATAATFLSGSTFNAHQAGPGVYSFTYTVDEVGTCPAKTANLVLEVHTPPEPGIPSDLVICENDNLSDYDEFDLHSLLAGEDNDGIWIDNNGTGELSNTNDTIIDIENIYNNYGPGKYEFSYFVNRDFGTCNDDFSEVSIYIFSASGAFNVADYCDNGSLSVDIEIQTNNEDLLEGFSYDLTYEIRNTNTNALVHTETITNAESFVLNPSVITAPGEYTIRATAISNISGIICNSFEITEDTFIMYNPSINVAETCFEKDATANAILTNYTQSNGDLINGPQLLDYEITYNAAYFDPNTLTNDTHIQTVTVQNSVVFTNGEGTVPIDLSLFDFSQLDDFYITSDDIHINFTNDANSALECIDYTFDADLIPEDISLSLNLDNACDVTSVDVVVDAPVILGGEYTITYTVKEVGNPTELVTSEIVITGGQATYDVDIDSLDEGNYEVELKSVQTDNTPCRTQTEFIFTEYFSIAGIPDAPTLSATQSFCLSSFAPNSPTLADIVVDSGSNLTWYDDATKSNVLPTTTVLVHGEDYYVTSNDTNNTCEDSAATQVTVNLYQTSLVSAPTTSPVFCQTANPTLEDMNVTTVNNGTVVWFDTNTFDNELPSTTILVDGENYFALERNNSCEGELTEFTPTVTPTPLTISSNIVCATPNDDFTLLENYATTDPGYTLVWYDSDASTVITDLKTKLSQNTTYYVTSLHTATNCESLQTPITVHITDEVASTDTSPYFCFEDEATIAYLDAQAENGGQLVWYDSATGNTVLAANEELENGTSYFVAEVFGNCEGPRTEYTPTIVNAPIPVSTQSNPICIAGDSNTSTLEAIEALITQTAGFNLVWFDNFANGNILPNTTTLTQGGLYYVANEHIISGCQSELIPITITLTSAVTSNDFSPTFCVDDNATIASLDATVGNQGALVWYTDINKTTILPDTTLLVDGNSYYAVEKVGNCESTPVAFTPTVISLPIPTNNGTNPICVSPGSTIQDIESNFTVTSPNTLIWYNENNNIITTAEVLSQNGTYYVATTLSSTSCTSEALAFSVNIVSEPTTTNTNPVFCAATNPTLNDIAITTNSNVSVVWYATTSGGTPLNSTDSLVNGITYYVAEEINTCASTRLAITPTVIDNTISLSSTMFCATATDTVSSLESLVTTQSTNTLIWYESDEVTVISNLSTALENNTTYYVASQDPTATCISAKLPITVYKTAAITSNETNPFFCSDANANLNSLDATAQNQGTIVWYDTAVGGTVLPNTTTLQDNTSYFAAEQNGSCEGPRTEFIPSIISTPLPTNTENNPICITQQSNSPATLASLDGIVTTGANFSLVWYDDFNKSNVLPATTNLSQNGLYYVASIHTASGCESDVISVTVNLTNTIISNNTTPAFCSNENPTIASLDATAANNGTIVWYDAATNGNELTDTTALTNNTSYFAAERFGTCESTPLEFIVTITDTPLPTHTQTNPICITQSNETIAYLETQGYVSTVTGYELVWYDNFTNGTILPTSTALTQNTTYYVASVHTVTGCESNRIPVAITIAATVLSNNTAPVFCSDELATLANLDATVANQGVLIWYDTLTKDNELPVSTPLTDGTSYFAVERFGGCESEPLEFVTSIVAPTTPVNNGADEICVSSGTTLNDIASNFSAPGYSLVWYDTTNTVIADTTVLSQNTEYSVASTYTGSTCFSDAINFTVQITDTPTANDTSPTFCGTDTATLNSLGASVANGGDLVWYDAATNGNVLDAATLLSTGNYYAVEKAGNCESTPLVFDVTVITPETPEYTGSNPTCVTQGTSLADLEATINYNTSFNLVWYATAENGTQLTNTTVLANNTSYFVATTDAAGICESERVEILINIVAAATTTTEDQLFCSSDNATLEDVEVTAPNGGTLIWYDSLTGGNELPITTPLANGTSYYVIEQNGQCGSVVRLQINITISTPPVPVFEGETNLCKLAEPTIATLEEGIMFDAAIYELVWYEDTSKSFELSTADELTEEITYFVVMRDIVTECEGEGIEITVSLSNCDPDEYGFFIPDGFSPNNDGINDTYYIPNIEYIFPDYELEIFNRYGQSMFKGDSSNPAWDGTNNGSQVETTSGVYFYILNKNRDNLKPEQGRLYLSK